MAHEQIQRLDTTEALEEGLLVNAEHRQSRLDVSIDLLAQVEGAMRDAVGRQSLILDEHIERVGAVGPRVRKISVSGLAV